jgi:O-antigen/teichoic acid export membrane protein
MNLLKKVIEGGSIFFIRQVFSTLIGIILSITLTRLLLPDDFGYISFVTIVLGILSLFSDGGLGLYLIQKKDQISDSEISLITNIQLLIWFLFEILLILSFLYFYSLTSFDIRGLIYLMVASLSVPFAIFKGGAIIVLERKLDFGKIALVEISEQLLYAVFAIGFTFLGLGVWGIVFSILIKLFGSFLVSNNLGAWKYSYKQVLEFPKIRQILITGISYQFPSILETFRSSINPILIGSLFGMKSAGFTDRSILIASIPVSLLGSVWQKVLFPLVSRLQNDKTSLEKLFEKSIYLHSIFDKALYLPLFLLGSSYISFFIGDKWLPILPSVLVFALGNILFSGYSSTSTAFLKGLGYPKVLAYWSMIQLPLAIVSIALFSNTYGFIGYAIGSQFLWLGVFYSYPVISKKINLVFLDLANSNIFIVPATFEA